MTGFGRISMRERAEALGGTVRVDTARGRGVVVEVRLP
jgi:signal transduction histidine kinase